MNAARCLLNDLAMIGATIEPVGDRLILRAGHNAIPAALVNRLREAKAEVMASLAIRKEHGPAWEGQNCVGEVTQGPVHDHWSAEDWQVFFDERAGIAEFDGGLVRTEAEARAFECCIIEWLNRNPASSPPGRCAWCGHPEARNAVVLPFGAEPGSHTWLHAECWRDWYAVRCAHALKALTLMGVGPALGSSAPHIQANMKGQVHD